MKQLLKISRLHSILTIVCVICWAHSSSASQLYLLGGHQVLLYKIINWWYFAPAEESARLCGESLEYHVSGNAYVTFVEHDSALKISFKDGLAHLLSVVGGCDACSPAASVQATGLNQDYFKEARAVVTIEELPHSNDYSIMIRSISNEASQLLQNAQNQLTVILTGTVQGLQNGKITLNPSGDLLGKCTDSNISSTAPAATTLVVTLSVGGPQLMSFDISAEDDDRSVQSITPQLAPVD